MLKQLREFFEAAFSKLLENMNMGKKQTPSLCNSVNDKKSMKKDLWRRRDGGDPYYVELIGTTDTVATVRDPEGVVYEMDANHFPLEYEKAF